MEKVIKQVADWEYFKKLPAEIYSFSLINELMVCGTQYRIFTYNNPQIRRSFSVLYDKATKDFLARTAIGLTEFYDVSFISSDLAVIEKVLIERLEKTLQGLAWFSPTSVCAQFAAKKIIKWTYAVQLPKQLAGFELYINPQQPVKGLNGSYVIIDYSDFATESNLIINYNIFRDQFFGEIRLRRSPVMTAEFDAKTLAELEGQLKTNLSLTLEKLRQRLQS